MPGKVIITCEYCGTIFEKNAKDCKPGHGRFCSVPCSNIGRHNPNISARLLARCEIDPTTGCWNWTGLLSRGGYGQVTVNRQVRRVHRLAAEIFLGFDYHSDLCICHRCDNPRCFNPEHLFPGTSKDNNNDRSQKGRTAHQLGSTHGHAKLTESDVIEIRKQHRSGAVQRRLAEQYGVSYATICNILKGKKWTHVP